ncbi:capsid assembly protein [Shinella zoogloeoides]|uniref:capsid assembly protein n=1 Tax=Shinella zoogloeoides TaxID=352475 RepID=UPI0028A72182|nr:hypothetical protein [Shinella zoogloeoides]
MTDQTTSNATPVSAPNGHDAAMAAKFDAAQAAVAANEQPAAPAAEEKPAVPDWVPEKFRAAEDPMKAMAEAYAALEQKQGAAPEVPASAEEAQAQLEAVGLDFNAYTAEYAESGELSQATYEALAKAGVPKEIVDAYISGQEAQAAQMINEVQAEFGGAEAYSQMVTWAATGLSKPEIAAFNKVMDSGDVDSIKLAIAGLQSKYRAANGEEPNLLNGDPSANEGDVFRSTAEVTAAMNDPRYRKDAAYRADVTAKLARSNVF